MPVTAASSSLTDPSLNTEWQFAKLEKYSHLSSDPAFPQSFTFLIRQILHLPILIILSNFVYSFLLVISLHFKFFFCANGIFTLISEDQLHALPGRAEQAVTLHFWLCWRVRRVWKGQQTQVCFLSVLLSHIWRAGPTNLLSPVLSEVQVTNQKNSQNPTWFVQLFKSKLLLLLLLPPILLSQLSRVCSFFL